MFVGEEETRVGLIIVEGTAKGKEAAKEAIVSSFPFFLSFYQDLPRGIVCGTLTCDEYVGAGAVGAVSIGGRPCFPAAGFNSSRQR